MKIFFAPDYRGGNPYQTCLAEHLTKVSFPSGYRRILPLTRSSRETNPDIIHLHWPEAYFHDSLIRELRYPLDLFVATHQKKLVITAHNLLPHNESHRKLIRRNIALTYQKAHAVIAHSTTAKSKILETFQLPSAKVHVIPHGDLACTIPRLIDKSEARRQLNLHSTDPICLMFGRVSPYKGIEEAIQSWPKTSVKLAIVGECPDPAMLQRIQSRAEIFELERCSQERLSLWLSATDVTLFNYTSILTSGSACLAHSLGIPILLPDHLTTIDLSGSNVFRFDQLTKELLEKAVHTPRSPDTNYLKQTAWPTIAAAHQKIYESL